jgi:hypothetical protein
MSILIGVRKCLSYPSLSKYQPSFNFHFPQPVCCSISSSSQRGRYAESISSPVFYRYLIIIIGTDWLCLSFDVDQNLMQMRNSTSSS